MSDTPSTLHGEQEQTQPTATPAIQPSHDAQTNKQTVNQEATQSTTIFTDQQEAGFQLVMFAPGQEPVDPPADTPPTNQPALIPPPITAPPLPLPTSTKPPYRTSPLVKGILIVQSLALIIGAVMMLYINVYEPARISAEATSTTGTAFAISTGTSIAVTSTAQIEATGYASDAATAFAVSQARSTATIVAQQSFYKEATKGTPTISSSLAFAEGSLGWEIEAFNDSGCYFTGGAYHIYSGKGFYNSCFATATNLADFTLEIEMTLVKGDTGGIFFRASNDSGYIFHLQSDGTYTLIAGRYDARLSRLSYTDLRYESHSAIKKGKESNLLTVITRGNRIYLYINKQYIDEISDSTYKSGQIGVYTTSEYEATDTAFRNLKIWKL